MSALLERAPISPTHNAPWAREAGSEAFAVRTQTADRHVVVPDIHGEYKVLDQIIDRYVDEPDVDFVFLGDLLDRKGMKHDPEFGVYQTLESIRELGKRAILTIGNHEWWLLASCLETNSHAAQAYNNDWLGNGGSSRIEQNVLSAYGISPECRDAEVAAQLHRRMMRVGHFTLLTSMAPYYETDRFIATHAGVLPDSPWPVQRGYLEEVAKTMADGYFREKPPQWFSMALATDIRPIRHTGKTVVSGHAHVLTKRAQRRTAQSPERVLHGGKRVRLASSLNPPTSAPAYVWQDWDNQIVEFPQEARSKWPPSMP